MPLFCDSILRSCALLLSKNTVILLLLGCVAFSSFGQTTFTSTSNGAWDDGATWGNTSPGTAGTDFPGRTDHAIIGHLVTVNATGDNGVAGVSPNSLGLSNVGAFNGSGGPAFYQTGNITVSVGGEFSSSVKTMLAGTTTVLGTFGTTAGDDIIQLGDMTIGASSTFSCGDDFVLSGNSQTEINNTTLSGDDLYLDHTDAQLCGTGAMSVGDAVQSFNSANVNTQVCSGFVITCTDGNCGLGGGGTHTGTGPFTLPIELISFEALVTSQREVKVTWVTASEIDNDFFTVEKSEDGIVWTMVDQIGGAGYSNNVLNYSLVDPTPYSELSYYRLKQTDFNGDFSYAPIRLINLNKLEDRGISLYPNPTSEYLTVKGDQEALASIAVYNMLGQSVSEVLQLVSASEGNLIFNLSELPPGTYSLVAGTTSSLLIKR